MHMRWESSSNNTAKNEMSTVSLIRCIAYFPSGMKYRIEQFPHCYIKDRLTIRNHAKAEVTLLLSDMPGVRCRIKPFPTTAINDLPCK